MEGSTSSQTDALRVVRLATTRAADSLDRREQAAAHLEATGLPRGLVGAETGLARALLAAEAEMALAEVRRITERVPVT